MAHDTFLQAKPFGELLKTSPIMPEPSVVVDLDAQRLCGESTGEMQ
jgi:hypothetical protein